MLWTVSMLSCSAGIYNEISDAILYLKQYCSDSPVISWWEREGKSLNFLISVENIPFEDRESICENINYVIRVLHDALDSHDGEDVEYVVTRLVSDVEEIAASYYGWVYSSGEPIAVDVSVSATVNQQIEWDLVMSGLPSGNLEWKDKNIVDEVFEFSGQSSRIARSSAA